MRNGYPRICDIVQVNFVVETEILAGSRTYVLLFMHVLALSGKICVITVIFNK